MEKANVLAIFEIASGLTYEEWAKVSLAVENAFKEKERKVKNGIKLEGTERIKYFYRVP